MNRPCTPPPRGILAPPSLGELMVLANARLVDERQGPQILAFIEAGEKEEQEMPNGVFGAAAQCRVPEEGSATTCCTLARSRHRSRP